MPNDDKIPDLGPLPQSDENARYQRESLKALNALLEGQDTVLFRDERVEDYGVDGAFELKVHGGMTNLRGQVQMKACASLECNEDGSVSLSVRTANLNYLLNGPAPIYVLFDIAKREFWFTWAHDENQRLQTVKPDWKQQGEITLRFTQRLVASGLDSITDRILREGRMHREIHDSLARNTTNEQVIVSLDHQSLGVTDGSQAQHILLASGPAIVAAGFPKEALRLLDLVAAATKNLPRIQLTAGYAQYMLGNHYNGLGHIRQAKARGGELSDHDRGFLEKLKDGCEFQVGIIDAAAFRERMNVRANALGGIESLEAKLDERRYRLLTERDREVRATLADEIRSITAQILATRMQQDPSNWPRNWHGCTSRERRPRLRQCISCRFRECALR